MSDFGQRLKWLREQRRLSQSKLAEKACFDHSFLSRLESGNRVPSRDAVNRLADALNATERERDELLDAAGFRATDPAAFALTDPTLRELARVLSDTTLPPGYVLTLRGAVQAMVDMADSRAAAERDAA